MELQTFPAVLAGECDVCGGWYDADDYVAQPSGDEVMCPECVIDHRLLDAA